MVWKGHQASPLVPCRYSRGSENREGDVELRLRDSPEIRLKTTNLEVKSRDLS